jgi:transcriptional regulator with XRE-family HTH domain
VEPITFGLYVKSIPEGDELTQRELAAKLGGSVRQLRSVERGRKGLSLDHA